MYKNKAPTCIGGRRCSQVGVSPSSSSRSRKYAGTLHQQSWKSDGSKTTDLAAKARLVDVPSSFGPGYIDVTFLRGTSNHKKYLLK